MQKLVYAVWGVCAQRSGEIVRSRVLFFSSFVTCTEKTAQLTEMLNILKHVSRACADYQCIHLCQRSTDPTLGAKNRFFGVPKA